MTGYVRKDTTNNIADGNVINAADLDAEFDGVQDAFNASTGHKHDGTAGEGATINALGPTQDVTISSTLLAPKTTNTVDIGSSSLKFKDLFLAGNGSVGGTLAVTGVATFTAQPILSSLTASRAVFSDGSKGLVSNAITGTGNVVMSASPTLTGTAGFENITASGTLGVTGVATFTAQPIVSSLTASRAVFSDGSKGLVSNAITGTGNVVMSASPTLTGTISAEALTASSSVTLSGGTANGVTYLNGSKVLTSGSALSFNGTNSLTVTANSAELYLAGGNSAAQGGFLSISRGGTAKILLGTASNVLGGGSNTSDDLTLFATAESRFYASSAEGMRLTSTGLGIGTSSPAYKLEVVAPAGDNIISTFRSGDATASNNAGGGFRSISSATATSRIAQMWLDADGANLSGGDYFYIQKNGNSGNVDLVQYSNAAMTFTTNAIERMRLDSAGNLGLGVTPSAWGSDYKSLQVGVGGSFNGGTSIYDFIELGANYRSATGDKYLSTTTASKYRQYQGIHSWYTAASGTAGDAISFTQAMTLDASGNLGVGTTSPSGARCVITTPGVDGANEVALSLNHGDGGLSLNQEVRLNFGQGSGASLGLAQIAASYTGGSFDGDLRFRTNSGGTISERARIDSAGNLLVGYTSSAQGLIGAYQTADSNGAYVRCTNASFTNSVLEIEADRNTTNNSFYAITYLNNGAGAYKFRVADSGNVTNTNNSYGAISDVKLKENIVDASPKLDALMQVQVRNYNLIGNPTKQLGVVAQELEAVFPSMVDESPDRDAEGNDLGTTTKSVKYSVFVPMLIKAIQELKAEFDAYKASHP